MPRRAQAYLKLGRLLLAILAFGALAVNAGYAQQPAPAAVDSAEGAAGSHAGGHQSGSGDSGTNNAINANTTVKDGAGADKATEPAAPPSRNPSKTSVAKPNGPGTSPGAVNGSHHASGPAAGGGSDAGRVDTSISVQTVRKARKTATEGLPKKSDAAHSPGTHDPQLKREPATLGGPARNAIGAAVETPTTAKAIAPAPQAIGSAPGDGNAKNAIGSTAKIDARPHVPDIVHPTPATTGAAGAQKTLLNNAAINGTGMRHLGSGPGILGGPATNVTGISGTGLRPKH